MEYIIPITLILVLLVYWTKEMVAKYICLKRDTYRDMDVLFTKIVNCMVLVVEKAQQPPEPINEITLQSLKDLTDIVKDLLVKVATLETTSKDLQGNVSSIQVGKAFIPRRRD